MTIQIQRLSFIFVSSLAVFNSVGCAAPPAVHQSSVKETPAVVGEHTADGYGVSGTSKRGIGVYGFSHEHNGVLGETEANGQAAVSGISKNDSHGVYGRSDGKAHGMFGTSALGAGVVGHSVKWTGVYGFSKEQHGVWGETEANGTAAVSGIGKNDSYGVYGRSDGNAHGIFGTSALAGGVVGHSVKWVGVYGFSKEHYGVWGESESAGNPAVVGINRSDSQGVYGRSEGKGHGVLGSSTAGSGIVGLSVQSAGVVGRSHDHDGVHGVTEGHGTAGVAGISKNDGHGVLGRSEGTGTGVWGISTAGSGVVGDSVKWSGVAGHSQEYEGVHGETEATEFAAVAGINQKDGTGVFGRSVGQGVGVFGIGNRGGISGESPTGPGVLGKSVDHHGVSGESEANERAGVAGVNKKHGYGIHGHSEGQGHGVYGTGIHGRGVVGDSQGHDGVLGIAHVAQKSGIVGLNDHASGFGVWAASLQGTGLYAKGSTAAHLESDHGVALRIVASENDDSNTSIMEAEVGTNHHVFNLSRTGQVAATQFESVRSTVAEKAKLSDAADSGDVVEIDPAVPGSFRLVRTPNSSYVAGVLVTSPGLGLGAATDNAHGEPGPFLAVFGRAPVKVCSENGEIHPGDLLVASGTPGHAMKSPVNPQPGTVIGKSLGAFRQGRGIVEMLIMLR